MGRKLTLHLGYDSDVEAPDSWGDGWWKLISFNPRHCNSERPDKYLPPDIGLRRKFKCNLAFIVSCYEHGGMAYSLRGEGQNCPWDTTSVAGILIFTGKPTDIKPKKRVEYARNFLNTYNHWANGNCYWYRIEEEDWHGNEVPNDCGCGGYIGWDDIKTAIKQENVFQSGDQIVVKGDAKDMAEYLDLPDGAEIVEEFEEIETPVEMGDYVL